MSERIIAAFDTAWQTTPELSQSLKQVTKPVCAPSPSAPGMQSVAGHFEFRDGARFRLRYSYSTDPKDTDCFLSVEDDVGLHFGFLDDINAYLLDINVSKPPAEVIGTALAKAVKMHTRASAKSSAPSTSTAPTITTTTLSASRRGVGRSAGYRIEDHPLAALLASQQLAARQTRRPFVLGHGNPGANAAHEAVRLLNNRLKDNENQPQANVQRDVGVGGAAAVGAAAAVQPRAPNAGVGKAATAASSSSDKKRNGESTFNFGSSRLATTALMQQLKILKKQNTREDGFSAQPKEDDLYTWDVKLYFDDPETMLSRDLAKIDNVDHLQLEFKFGSSFPQEPPIVRFVSPLIIGGHVSSHGAICMELLTAAGWTPVNSIDAVCIQIRALLIAGNARIDVARPLSTERYTLEGALRDMSSIVFSHGWNLIDRFELDGANKRQRNNLGQ